MYYNISTTEWEVTKLLKYHNLRTVCPGEEKNSHYRRSWVGCRIKKESKTPPDWLVILFSVATPWANTMSLRLKRWLGDLRLITTVSEDSRLVSALMWWINSSFRVSAANFLHKVSGMHMAHIHTIQENHSYI